MPAAAVPEPETEEEQAAVRTAAAAELVAEAAGTGVPVGPAAHHLGERDCIHP